MGIKSMEFEMANREIQKEARAYKVEIFICGNPLTAEQLCRDYCDRIGQCVTITKTNYVFRGGNETGLIIGLINYARFPKAKTHIWQRAVDLAYKLKEGLHQGSFTIQDHERSVFVSTRDEDQP